MIKYREYKNYDEYLEHQKRKIDELLKKPKGRSNIFVREEGFAGQQKRFYREFRKLRKWIYGKEVLCIGARMGCEVAAMRQLGYKNAIGIDLNHGPDGKYVIKGDFNNMPFENDTFDTAFCNCIDHVWRIEDFSKEVSRVLVNKGLLILDISNLLDFYKNHRIDTVLDKKVYESFVCDNFDDIIEKMKPYELKYQTTIKKRLVAGFINNK